LVAAYLNHLLEKDDPPASKSYISVVVGLLGSFGVSPLPQECVKSICDFVFGTGLLGFANGKFRDYIQEQHHNYSRLPGKNVLHHMAKVRERVRFELVPQQVRTLLQKVGISAFYSEWHHYQPRL
jgi:hypothetical protein